MMRAFLMALGALMLLSGCAARAPLPSGLRQFGEGSGEAYVVERWEQELGTFPEVLMRECLPEDSAAEELDDYSGVMGQMFWYDEQAIIEQYPSPGHEKAPVHRAFLLHELGHALGFGHSDTGIMRLTLPQAGVEWLSPTDAERFRGALEEQ